MKSLSTGQEKDGQPTFEVQENLLPFQKENKRQSVHLNEKPDQKKAVRKYDPNGSEKKTVNNDCLQEQELPYP